jgi:hypothetical protein
MPTINEYPIVVTIPSTTGSNPGWPGRPGVNRVAFIADSTLVRSIPSLQAPVMCTLAAGDEADLGGVINRDGSRWCMVTLRDKRSGYIPADTPVRSLKYVKLKDPSADIRSAPGGQGYLIRTLARGDAFLLMQTVDGNSVRIRDASGHEGFIDGKAKIESLQATASQNHDPQHDMLVGGLWCVGGILVTAITYSAAQGGGHYVVAWGAILFGGIQFMRGLFRCF